MSSPETEERLDFVLKQLESVKKKLSMTERHMEEARFQKRLLQEELESLKEARVVSLSAYAKARARFDEAKRVVSKKTKEIFVLSRAKYRLGIEVLPLFFQEDEPEPAPAPDSKILPFRRDP